MKKVTKALITAATVAAVVGVGAVSFAKWEQGTSENATVTGTTGSIVILGDLSASDDLDGKLLVPYDQVDQFDPDTMAKEMTITLEYDGDDGSIITMTASGDVGSKLEWDSTGAGGWQSFTTGVTVEAGEIKIRLNSDDEENDMDASYTITFSVAAPSVD